MKKIKNNPAQAGLATQAGIATPVLIILVIIAGAFFLNNYRSQQPAPVIEEEENVIYNDDATVMTNGEETTVDSTTGNKNPRIELLTGYLKGKYSNEDTVQIRFESSDPDGSIEKLVIYANNNVIAEVANRGVTEGAALAVLGKSLDKAVENAVDLVEDEKEDDVDTYSFRGTGDWSGDVTQCGITSGYMVIAHSEDKSYDIRMTTDFSEQEICYDGSAISYMNKYFFKWNEPEAGDYTIYGVTHDNNGATKRSKSFDITVTK